MAKRISNPVLSENDAKKLLYNCMICGKAVEGWYSSHEGGGTCSRACMNVQDAKPRFPGHTEEDYFKRLGETYGNEDGFENDEV